MDSQKEELRSHSPNFEVFPLFNAEETEPESGVTVPAVDDVEEVKDWVDFKEM